MNLWQRIFGMPEIEKRVLNLEAQQMVLKEEMESIEDKLMNHRHNIETPEVQDGN